LLTEHERQGATSPLTTSSLTMRAQITLSRSAAHRRQPDTVLADSEGCAPARGHEKATWPLTAPCWDGAAFTQRQAKRSPRPRPPASPVVEGLKSTTLLAGLIASGQFMTSLPDGARAVLESPASGTW
jgi:hypothetical protein